MYPTPLGLARSDAGAARVESLGAEVVRGSLDDVDGLRAAAKRTDGVVHLGYNHDFARMDAAAATDRAAIEAFAGVLQGTGGPLKIASGVLGLSSGRVGTERDMPAPGVHPRTATAAYTRGLAEQGVRSRACGPTAPTHFDWIGRFFGADAPASSALTREMLEWTPTEPGLLADIAAGHYPGL